MRCAKCEEGTLIRVFFKKAGREGILCEFCGTVWFESESIRPNTGHQIQSLTHNEDTEYTFVDAEKNSENTKPAMYPAYK